MFGPEFFPTPPEVIKKMLEPYYIPEPDETDDPKAYRKYRYARENNRLHNMSILEPSAGKGNILDFISEEFYSNHRTIKRYCIEKDPELQHILREKGYRVIADDFLKYNGDYYFDLIIMNPPFSNGDQHLLHAWDVMREGDIICLLNAETIRNAFTERRKLLRNIIKDNDGKVEFIGQVFMDAERTSSVDCCIVRLTKKSTADRLDFKFENITKEGERHLSEDLLKNPIATRDVVGNMISQYERTKDYFVKFMEAMEGLDYYGRGLVTPNFEFRKLIERAYSGDKRKDYNDFCDIMKSEIWQVVINNLDMEKYMTYNVRKNFAEFTQHQGALDFTKENVANLVQMIFENRWSILDRAVVEVFDLFTRFHKDNRCHVEGWNTNDKWKVNRKIILPNWLRMSWEKPADRMRFGAEYQINYSYNSQYADIDKVMCYITGRPYEQCNTIAEALNITFKRIGKVYKGPHKGECQSDFFNIKFFMKGTIHIEFRDPKLWEEFNLRACAGKAWLPEDEMNEYKERQKSKDTPTETIQMLLLSA